jgi:RNA polymerase sigma factor (sigma-70 family)
MSNVVPEFDAHLKADPFTAVPEVHLPWLIKVASKFATGPVRDSEAFSDACLGLMLAADKYDTNRVVDGKPVRFITFAVWCVRNEIIRGRQKRQLTKAIRERGIAVINLGAESQSVNDRESLSQLDAQVLEKLKESVGRLKLKDREIIERRLAGETLREIGDSVGLTRERIRQIEQVAQEKLHKILFKMGVKRI